MIMDIDTKIARVKELIFKREEIDAELSTMLGVMPKAEKSNAARSATRRAIRLDHVLGSQLNRFGRPDGGPTAVAQIERTSP
jgi:hypothetical protein